MKELLAMFADERLCQQHGSSRFSRDRLLEAANELSMAGLTEAAACVEDAAAEAPTEAQLKVEEAFRDPNPHNTLAYLSQAYRRYGDEVLHLVWERLSDDPPKRDHYLDIVSGERARRSTKERGLFRR